MKLLLDDVCARNNHHQQKHHLWPKLRLRRRVRLSLFQSRSSEDAANWKVLYLVLVRAAARQEDRTMRLYALLLQRFLENRIPASLNRESEIPQHQQLSQCRLRHPQ